MMQAISGVVGARRPKQIQIPDFTYLVIHARSFVLCDVFVVILFPTYG